MDSPDICGWVVDVRRNNGGNFWRRPDARSFGLLTYGVSTSNSTIELSDSSMLVLTSARYGDRLGRLYGSRLQPDTPVVAERNEDPAQDATVQAALRWLSKNRCQVVRRW